DKSHSFTATGHFVFTTRPNSYSIGGSRLRERQRRMAAAAIGVDPVRVARSVAGHRALVDALAAGDAARFSTELVEHMKVVTEVD
ncbi:FCD domain-containing protein, partial [Mycobacteroides abscessus]